MFQSLSRSIRDTLRTHEPLSNQTAIDTLVVETPPNVKMGEVALPVAFALARSLRRPPREIATELAAVLGETPGVARVEVAGGGYLNLYLDRQRWTKALIRSIREQRFSRVDADSSRDGKVIVEHTNINPNKAAHIGHLRNAVLGDSFVRVLRFLNHHVEVQNYIDNTGVQVADVVVGFQHLARVTPEEILASGVRFDYYCWDLYARVTSFFEEEKSRLSLRQDTLHAIESGHGEIAHLAEVVAMNNVRAHLATMRRLDVHYDLLPRESDILHLQFWQRAFEMLRECGAIQLAEKGPHAGCWVMKRSAHAAGNPEEEEGADEKVIVRSNGTVTYVGKDIAYQLWKFGLLGLDFQYRRFHEYSTERVVWVTSSEKQNGDGRPAFGSASRVYNVIDKRQSYLQDIVVEGLRSLNHHEQAAHSIHFSYEMVALSPRCCEELGFELSEQDRQRPYVEVSGRRGLGVKADDLISQLEERALAEVRARHQLDEDTTAHIAHQIAVAALRYFMLRYTRNSVIAFDFEEALSFEGETGPYLQYSVVRANNILRKAQEEGQEPLEPCLGQAAEGDLHWLDAMDDVWELVLLASRLSEVARQSELTLELAVVAKYAFQLAQKFNLFYHRHHILSEEDQAKRAFLLVVVDLFRKQMTRTLELLGIEIPDRM